MQYADLANEIKEKWNLETGRVEKAVKLASTRGMVLNALRNEHGQSITPSENLIIVRGSKGGFYYVRMSQKSCTCIDHKRGNVCKHRIAAYLSTELPKRIADNVRRKAARNSKRVQTLIAELGY